MEIIICFCSHRFRKTFFTPKKMMSEQVLKSLYKLFNQPMPKELDGLLLPDAAARVF